jgi:membrane complex biogenesis BtpA family protein
VSGVRTFLGLERPLIGVVHLAALPGAPAHRGGIDRVIERARRDAAALVAAGVEVLIVENFGDAPFFKDRVPPETVSALTAAALAVAAEVDVPLGINCLRNDAHAALAVAAACDAAFVRINVLTGAMLTDQGVIEGRAAEVARLRARLCPRVVVAADVLVKHAVPLAPMDPAEVARDTLGRGGADALIVTGTRTGAGVDDALITAVRGAAGRHPVLIGSGLTTATVDRLVALSDGAIVGSALQRGGRAGRVVDPERAVRFVAAYRRARDSA